MTQKIKNNKACPAKLQRSRGFVLLFAVTVSAILLAVALGITNIALKEVQFSTSAKDTNNAFFAADTGTEYMLFLDKTPTNFPAPTTNILQTYTPVILSGLGGTGVSCAIVTITKNNITPPVVTTVISKGYNTGGGISGSCNPTNNSVEREIDTTD